MKYYLTIINELKALLNELKLIEYKNGGIYINESIHILDLYFDNKIKNIDHFYLDYNGCDTVPKFLENENELNNYLFNSLASFLKSEGEFLENDIKEYKEMKFWRQQ